jgi:hypothetical protein
MHHLMTYLGGSYLLIYYGIDLKISVILRTVIKLLMAFWGIQGMFSNFLFLQVDIRDTDGLKKVFASTR